MVSNIFQSTIHPLIHPWFQPSIVGFSHVFSPFFGSFPWIPLAGGSAASAGAAQRASRAGAGAEPRDEIGWRLLTKS